ncbi:DUF4278 domain-containing protein [Thermocoleostomius sinensis]|uniref:DUF4278 domain-containing protein n=1 Tax=Thermocoleostomius sinensis A174 TaxID=2016057 RepID=A0A9E9C894_9CYAN|nr:DUF4278 domain-containing protein [Thermocoleostomius sinensis]WAL60078.1 DUF4278 domain-containing protein [Thermocoleostomius sinensis A174]
MQFTYRGVAYTQATQYLTTQFVEKVTEIHQPVFAQYHAAVYPQHHHVVLHSVLPLQYRGCLYLSPRFIAH